MSAIQRWIAVCTLAAVTFSGTWLCCQLLIGLDPDASTAIAGAVLAVVTLPTTAWAAQSGDGRRSEPTPRAAPAAVTATARKGYLRRVRQLYDRVDLEVLTPLNDQDDYPPVPLMKVFVPPQVKADPPPVELPREVTLRMRDDDAIDSRPLPEAVGRAGLDRAREYELRPPVDVLPLIAGDGERLVLLGDPGSGKSTLARYLVCALAESKVTGPLARLEGWLPLLVELREYARYHEAAATDFLDFLEHQHTQQALDLPRSAIEGHLSDGRALVVFDGLDEIFDAALRARVARQIAGFAQRYQHARVIVTSRPVGYQKTALEAVGFKRYKLQDLDIHGVARFVHQWYAIACHGNPAEAARLEDRLNAAIRDSRAVGELAGNPMLLTILAIIGRRRALPRDRASVYEHAVTVLVEQWDPSKFLAGDTGPGVPYLHPADRLEMLRLVARKLQDSPAGLSGNFISGRQLVEEFVAFLRQRDPANVTWGEASAAAERMLGQFRDRNFILSRFGGEVYGFVHRSFLEYLTAADIVYRFDKERSLSEDELIDGYFAGRCRDPAWHEVLQLSAGMLAERFVSLAVRRMLAADPHWAASEEVEPQHILVAIRCIGEVRKIGLMAEACQAATDQIIRMLTIAHRRMTRTYSDSLNRAIERSVLPTVAALSPYWPGSDRYLAWFTRVGFIEADDVATCSTATRLAVALGGEDARLHEFLRAQARQGWSVYHRSAAAAALIQRWPDDAESLQIVRRQSQTDPSWEVRHGAVRAVVGALADDYGTLELLRERLRADENADIRRTAVQALAAHWRDDPDTLRLLVDRAANDGSPDVRAAALHEVAHRWPDDPAALPLVRLCAVDDPHDQVRRGALLTVASVWPGEADSLALLKRCADADPSTDVRRAALTAVATGWPDDAASLGWLRRQAQSDADPSVRQAAVAAIADGWPDHPKAQSFLFERLHDPSAEVRQAAVRAIVAGRLDTVAATGALRRLAEEDPSADVRQVAMETVATHLRHDAETRRWLERRAQADPVEYVRVTAVRLVSEGWNEDPLVEVWLHGTAAGDSSAEVRRAALRAVAVAGREDGDTLPWLLRRGVEDDDVDVRLTAVQLVTDGWGQATGVRAWLRERCVADPDADVRNVAMRAVVARWHDDPRTLPLLRERARLDEHEYIRRAALWMIADGWPDDPGSLQLLRDRATADSHEVVRRAATQAIAVGWHDDAQTLALLLSQATGDRHEHVRAGAVRAIAGGWHDDPQTRRLLFERATADAHQAVRLLILQIMIAGWATRPETLRAVLRIARLDPAPAVRQTAVEALRRYWPADQATTV